MSRTLVFCHALGDKSGSDDSQIEGVTYPYDKPTENLAPKGLKSIMQKPPKTTPANTARQVRYQPKVTSKKHISVSIIFYFETGSQYVIIFSR